MSAVRLARGFAKKIKNLLVVMVILTRFLIQAGSGAVTLVRLIVQE
jgi:uncharacterized membrane protein